MTPTFELHVKGPTPGAPAPPVYLPERRASVALIPPSWERIPGRVLRRAGNRLTVVAMTPVPKLEPDQLEGMVLEFPIRTGRVLLGGRFLQDENASELFRIAEPHLIEVIQQRAFPRVNAIRTIVLHALDAKASVVAHTVNIGGGGCLVDGADELALNQRVHFELLLSRGDLPVRGGARVIRIDAEVAGRRGLLFEEIEDGERERVMAFVSQYL
jgi:hypothetical protein